MTPDERPPARTRPRPASDSGADPADLTPPAPRTPASAPVARAAVAPAHPAQGDPMAALTPTTGEGSWQLGVRVGQEYFELVDRVKAETGASKRKIIENALAYTYASYMKSGEK
jgi:hypothetical protein